MKRDRKVEQCQAAQSPNVRPAIIDETGLTVIHGRKNRYGWSKTWGQHQFCELAMRRLYLDHMPENIDLSKLTRDVNQWLIDNADWKATRRKLISRRVVSRVYEERLEEQRG